VTSSLEKVLTGIPNARARPKSASLGWPFVINEEVLGLEIAVHHSVRMAEIDSLVHENVAGFECFCLR
jgi:hypothetical protein